MDLAPKFVVDLSGAEPVESLVPLTDSEKGEREAESVVSNAKEATEATYRTNALTIEQRARNALTANAAYLALADPLATAQNTAQIKRLTRQVNGLFRLLLSELQDVSDT